jgi:hypothetical protein
MSKISSFLRRLPGRGLRCTMPKMLTYRQILMAPGLAGFLCLAGCGHPTAASPIASAIDAEPAAEPSVAQVAEPQPVSVAAPVSEQAAVTEKPPSHAAPPAAGQRPPADRTPTRPGDAEKITFEDLNLGMPADVVFREFMLENSRAKELEGKRISIVGYMHGSDSLEGIKKFILLKNTQCKFGKGGQADHLADVNLRPNTSIKYTDKPLKVEGTLRIEPFQGDDGNTWSIYLLENAQIR